TNKTIRATKTLSLADLLVTIQPQAAHISVRRRRQSSYSCGGALLPENLRHAGDRVETTRVAACPPLRCNQRHGRDTARPSHQSNNGHTAPTWLAGFAAAGAAQGHKSTTRPQA